MLDTWDQRVRRDGIVLKKISFPVPPPSHGRSRRSAARARSRRATKVLHFCHITNLTGQIFPVKQICDEARAARHQDDRRRRARVRALPVQGWRISAATTTARACTSGCSRRSAPASSTCGASTSRRCGRSRRPTPTRKNDIRKFEEIGTHPAANHNAIAEALAFHEGIGIERKAARLRYLRDRWATRLATQAADPHPHEPRSGAVVRDRHRADHRRADAEGRRAAVGAAGGSSPRRSCTRSTKACASRRTSTRRSKRVDTFAAAMEEIVKKGAE